jgi:hypothetical protein
MIQISSNRLCWAISLGVYILIGGSCDGEDSGDLSFGDVVYSIIKYWDHKIIAKVDLVGYQNLTLCFG